VKKSLGDGNRTLERFYSRWEFFLYVRLNKFIKKLLF
jgi:hypothetical protein